MLLFGDRFTTPLGPMWAAVDETGTLVRLEFGEGGPKAGNGWIRDPGRCRSVVWQLGQYFEGRRREFDLPLAPRGTPFQQSVWRELRRIPFGSRVSYSDVARRIGRPAAVRAVGAANGANPIAIVIACHRVVGRDGSLTGYGGGLALKQWLLDHEAGLRPLAFSRGSAAEPAGRPVR